MTHESLPHSGHYFGDQRDFWWNYDFLELMAKRWQFSQCHSLLDVGCGVGHWGHILAPFLPKNCQIQGIDPEEKWIAIAKEKVNKTPSSVSFHYQVGSVEKLPFADNTFDMVTCQTVLIHVADPLIALQEMLRVLKPGGLIAVAEPNNIAPLLVFDNISIREPMDNLLESIRFHLMCEKGKQALGLGYNSIGDLLPEYFAKQHLHQIQIYLSDKTSALIPPYQSKEEQVIIEQSKTWANQEIAIWPKAETKKYYLAGGGTAEKFETHWKQTLTNMQELQTQLQNKLFYSVGTCLMYLISGRK